MRWIIFLLLAGCASSVKHTSAPSISDDPASAVGKPWRDLSPGKGAPDIPFQLSGKQYLAFRNFEPAPGQLSVTVVELVGGMDRAADTILAVLNLRSVIQAGEMATTDCEVEGQTGMAFIGLVPSDSYGKTMKPRRAWRITAKRMKFEEVKTTKLTCTPEQFSID
jgi:hypothetical protein